MAGNVNDEEVDPILLVNKLTPHFLCPVCGQLYRNPVINIKCGHTFCKNCASGCSRCPVDDEQCDSSQLIVNRLVVGQIDELLIYCKYGIRKQNGAYVQDPTGCQEQIYIGNRHQHENECSFTPKHCPNDAENCGTFCSSELDQHLQICPYYECEHKDKGCEFHGRKEEVKDHLEKCGYRGLPKTISQRDFQDQTKALESENRCLREKLDSLTKRVEILEGNKNSLESSLEMCLSNYQNLNKKHEALQTLVEQLMTTRNRRSMTSPGNSAEAIRQRTSSTSSFPRLLSGDHGPKLSPSPSLKPETWKMPFQFKCIGSLRGHKKAVWCFALYKQRLYSSGGDNLIKVWDLDVITNGCIKTMEGHTGVVHTLAVYENKLVSGGEDLSIRVWNLDSQTEENCIFNAHDNLISSMVVVGDNLFTASYSLIKVWDMKTLALVHTISGLHHWVRALVVSLDKECLYSGCHNTIGIWSTSGSFQHLGNIPHNYGSIYSLAITHDFLIVGTYNRNIQVFDLSKNQHVFSLRGHIGVVTSLTVTPSGRFLFSSSSDQTIMVWNLENMLPIQTLHRHEAGVNAVILYGDFLLSGSEDHEIKLFQYFQMQMGFALQT
uniref:E3 ubiquitin-protein ligase TRAF7-like isoform X1 n=1 Tax=Crassostrea virginica TaxID=6565 RepID=A0A8B8ESM5_CRAVI|nr:E3 ubiquitin-protein ligase TRAF7-like isoform X1 [Crassostrea virginica]